MVLCLNISSLQLHLFVTLQYEILLVLLVELCLPNNYLFPDHSTVFHGYPCKHYKFFNLKENSLKPGSPSERHARVPFHWPLWCVLTFCHLLHQLLQPWRLLIRCGQVLHTPCWKKVKRLQRKWKETWMALNQQPKEISKWNTPVISCAAQIQRQQQKIIVRS